MKAPRERLAALLALALAVVPAAAGCGGGGDSPALATVSLSRAEFVERAGAICARGRREALEYRPAAEGESRGEALDAAIEGGLLPSIDETIERLYALGAPAAEKRQVEALLAAMGEALGKAEDLNPPTVERIEDLFARSGALARRAGVSGCAYGG